MITLLNTSSAVGVLVLSLVIVRSLQSRTWKHRLSRLGPRVNDGPFVSIIVPARNEEDALKQCLPTILNQTYEHFEVIVVNDQSTDDTARVLSEFNDEHLRVIHGEEAPEDSWSGKSWAVHQGVQRAKGDWYLFTDADMTFEPWLLSRVVAEHEEDRNALFSILPQASCEGWWNKLVLPLHGFMIFLGFPIGNVNDPKDSTAIAAGGFMFMNTSLYEKTGGHRAIRTNIAEDLAMAKSVKDNGGTITLKTSEGLNSEHYESPIDMINGISKHLLAAPWPPSILITLGQILFVLFYVLPLVSLWPSLPSNTFTIVCGTSIAFLSHMIYGTIHTQLDHSPAWGLLLIPALFFYSVIGWYSLYHQLRFGGPTWKGRRVKQTE